MGTDEGRKQEERGSRRVGWRKFWKERAGAEHWVRWDQKWERSVGGPGSGAAAVSKQKKNKQQTKQNKNNPKSVGMDHFWFLSWLESQSRPSYRPSPLVAHVAWMYQLRWRSACKPSLSVISAAFMALGRSCKKMKLSCWMTRSRKENNTLAKNIQATFL